MPVYNEQVSVRKVVQEWFTEIENWTENFIILAINDGSSDGTHSILERISEQRGECLEVITRENRGHGPQKKKGLPAIQKSPTNAPSASPAEF